MLRDILVPLDGSPLAEAALSYAKQLAGRTGATCTLVRAAHHRPVFGKAGRDKLVGEQFQVILCLVNSVALGLLMAGQGGTIVTYSDSELAELEAEARAYLEASVGQIGSGGPGAEAVVRYGDPASAIAAAAQEYGAAAVVMATHGRTGLLRSILGSVAGGVLHHSSSPVVLIKPAKLRGAEEPLACQPAAAAVC